jgi:hypothetical protein
MKYGRNPRKHKPLPSKSSRDQNTLETTVSHPQQELIDLSVSQAVGSVGNTVEEIHQPDEPNWSDFEPLSEASLFLPNVSIQTNVVDNNINIGVQSISLLEPQSVYSERSPLLELRS